MNRSFSYVSAAIISACIASSAHAQTISSETYGNVLTKIAAAQDCGYIGTDEALSAVETLQRMTNGDPNFVTPSEKAIMDNSIWTAREDATVTGFCSNYPQIDLNSIKILAGY